MSRPRRSRRLRRIVVLAALPVGLLVAEGVVRVLDIRALPVPESSGGVLMQIKNGELRFENRANACKRTVYRELDGQERKVEMWTNEQRFRGPVVERRKPADVLRVACLGDSHTFGDGVADGETWPDHLRALADASGELRVEVLNCGVNAYDTMQEVVWFERRVLPFQPDVVVLQYFVNDAAARGVGGGEGGDPLVSWTHPRRAGSMAALRSRSRFLDVLCDAIFRRRNLSVYSDEQLTRYHRGSPGWMRVQDALRRLRDTCREHDILLLVALFPFLVERDGRYTSHEAFELVAEFCAAEGIATLDAEPALLASGEKDLRNSPHDYHANGRAYELFAGAIAERLASDGLPFQARVP